MLILLTVWILSLCGYVTFNYLAREKTQFDSITRFYEMMRKLFFWPSLVWVLGFFGPMGPRA